LLVVSSPLTRPVTLFPHTLYSLTMRTFALSVFATLAFGIFCSAAPLPATGVAIDVGDTIDVDLDLDLGGPVDRRDAETPTKDITLEITLNGIVSDVSKVGDKIADLKEGVTVDVLEPLLEDVKDILEGAIKVVKSLLDGSAEKALTTATGELLDVKTVAQLIANVVRVVLLLLKAVLDLVSGTVKDEVLPLLRKIGELLGDLLYLVLQLVGKLLSGVLLAVVALIADLINIIDALDIKILIKLFSYQ